MTVKASSPPSYEFGGFRLDAAKRLLTRRDGAPVPLTPRVFETLLYLVEHSGEVLDRERLMDAVWPDAVVEDNNLTQNISMLRRVLRQAPGSNEFIVTVPGRGYRFVAEVRQADSGVLVEGSAVAEPGRAEEPPSGKDHGRAGAGRSARWPWVISLSALTILVLGVAIFYFWNGRRSEPDVANSGRAAFAVSDKSIAILPFENLSANPEDAFFAEGVQDDILTALAQVADLKVISRSSVRDYTAGPRRNLRAIGGGARGGHYAGRKCAACRQ